ncbi:hypothetical protein BDV28DRAFT_145450 [Aspergillus coremiiformis]|uniref:Short chain dehydrogenase/reductase n=1 Tax=Aspergillus coremiiformis TaxID=138285 RepID=A0A5N6ZF52_9EURO|nr:hypothetical protein BDV28DRAFT_145450 [Aspergillus coremiiformis]
MSVFQAQKTALITGAASGIGFAAAKLCRSRGMHLALLDIDAVHLRQAQEELATVNPSLKTESYQIDVGDKNQWRKVVDQIKSAFTHVDLVLLNAARQQRAQSQYEGKLKPWADVESWKQTFDTNVFGTLNGVEAVLPLLLSSTTSKSIVITGSKQGITNPPGASTPAYNASKAAIKNLTEHLAHDLRSDPATAHISTHLFIPGWTWTGFMGNVGPTHEDTVTKMSGAWYPSQAAEVLVDGVEKGSFYIFCPDGDTDWALDQARMQWANDDMIEGRPAISRWETSWKERADEGIRADAVRRRT